MYGLIIIFLAFGQAKFHAQIRLVFPSLFLFSLVTCKKNLTFANQAIVGERGK
jgi:hypothetical protein